MKKIVKTECKYQSSENSLLRRGNKIKMKNLKILFR